MPKGSSIFSSRIEAAAPNLRDYVVDLKCSELGSFDSLPETLEEIQKFNAMHSGPVPKPLRSFVESCCSMPNTIYYVFDPMGGKQDSNQKTRSGKPERPDDNMNKSWGDIVDTWSFLPSEKMSLDSAFLKVYASRWNTKAHYSTGDVCSSERTGEFANSCIMLGGCHRHSNKRNPFNCPLAKNNDYSLYSAWSAYRRTMGSTSKDRDFDYECSSNACQNINLLVQNEALMQFGPQAVRASAFRRVPSFLNDKGDFVTCGSVNMGIIPVSFINYFFNSDDSRGGSCGDGKIPPRAPKYDRKEMMKLYASGTEVPALIHTIRFLVRSVEQSITLISFFETLETPHYSRHLPHLLSVRPAYIFDHPTQSFYRVVIVTFDYSNVLFCDLDPGRTDREAVRSLLDNTYSTHRKRKRSVSSGSESGSLNKNRKSSETSPLNPLDTLHSTHTVFDFATRTDSSTLGGLKSSASSSILPSSCTVTGLLGNTHIYSAAVDPESLPGTPPILSSDSTSDSDEDLNMTSSDEIDTDDEENDDRRRIDVSKMASSMFSTAYDEVSILSGDSASVSEDRNSRTNTRKISPGPTIDPKKPPRVHTYRFFILERLRMLNDTLNSEDPSRVFSRPPSTPVTIVNGHSKRNSRKEPVLDSMSVDENGYVGYLNVDQLTRFYAEQFESWLSIFDFTSSPSDWNPITKTHEPANISNPVCSTTHRKFNAASIVLSIFVNTACVNADTVIGNKYSRHPPGSSPPDVTQTFHEEPKTGAHTEWSKKCGFFNASFSNYSRSSIYSGKTSDGRTRIVDSQVRCSEMKEVESYTSKVTSRHWSLGLLDNYPEAFPADSLGLRFYQYIKYVVNCGTNITPVNFLFTTHVVLDRLDSNHSRTNGEYESLFSQPGSDEVAKTNALKTRRLALKNAEELFRWATLGSSDHCNSNNLFSDHCSDDSPNSTSNSTTEDSLTPFSTNTTSPFFSGYVPMDPYACISSSGPAGGIKGKSGSLLKLRHVSFTDIFALDAVKYMCLVVGTRKAKWTIDRENHEKQKQVSYSNYMMSLILTKPLVRPDVCPDRYIFPIKTSMRYYVSSALANQNNSDPKRRSEQVSKGSGVTSDSHLYVRSVPFFSSQVKYDEQPPVDQVLSIDSDCFSKCETGFGKYPERDRQEMRQDIMLLYVSVVPDTMRFFIPGCFIRRLKMYHDESNGTLDADTRSFPQFRFSFQSDSLPKKLLKDYFIDISNADDNIGLSVTESIAGAGFACLDLHSGYMRDDLWIDYGIDNGFYNHIAKAIDAYKSCGERGNLSSEAFGKAHLYYDPVLTYRLDTGSKPKAQSKESTRDRSVGYCNPSRNIRSTSRRSTFRVSLLNHGFFNRSRQNGLFFDLNPPVNGRIDGSVPIKYTDNPYKPFSTVSEIKDKSLRSTPLTISSGGKFYPDYFRRSSRAMRVCDHGFNRHNYYTDVSKFVCVPRGVFSTDFIRDISRLFCLSGVSPPSAVLKTLLSSDQLGEYQSVSSVSSGDRAADYNLRLGKVSAFPHCTYFPTFALDAEDLEVDGNLSTYYSSLVNNAQQKVHKKLWKIRSSIDNTKSDVIDPILLSGLSLSPEDVPFTSLRTLEPNSIHYLRDKSIVMQRRALEDRKASFSDLTNFDLEVIPVHFIRSDEYNRTVLGLYLPSIYFYPGEFEKSLSSPETSPSNRVKMMIRLISQEMHFIRVFLSEIVGEKYRIASSAYFNQVTSYDEMATNGSITSSVSPVDMPPELFFVSFVLSTRMSLLTDTKNRFLSDPASECIDASEWVSRYRNYKREVSSLWDTIYERVLEYHRCEEEKRESPGIKSRNTTYASLLMDEKQHPMLPHTLSFHAESCPEYYAGNLASDPIITQSHTRFSQLQSEMRKKTKLPNSIALRDVDERFRRKFFTEGETDEDMARCMHFLDSYSNYMSNGTIPFVPNYTNQFRSEDDFSDFYTPKFPALNASFDLKLNPCGRYAAVVTIPDANSSVTDARAFFYDMCSFMDMIYQHYLIRSERTKLHDLPSRISGTHPWLVGAYLKIIEQTGDAPNDIDRNKHGYTTRIKDPGLLVPNNSSDDIFYFHSSRAPFPRSSMDVPGEEELDEEDYYPPDCNEYPHSQLANEAMLSTIKFMHSVTFITPQSDPSSLQSKMERKREMERKGADDILTYQPILFIPGPICHDPDVTNAFSTGRGVRDAVFKKFFEIYGDPKFGMCKKVSSKTPGNKPDKWTEEEFIMPTQVFAFHPDLENMLSTGVITRDNTSPSGFYEGSCCETGYTEKYVLGDRTEVVLGDAINTLMRKLSKCKNKIISCYPVSPTKGFKKFLGALYGTQDFVPHPHTYNNTPFYLPKVISAALLCSEFNGEENGMKLPYRFHPALWGSWDQITDVDREVHLTRPIMYIPESEVTKNRICQIPDVPVQFEYSGTDDLVSFVYDRFCFRYYDSTGDGLQKEAHDPDRAVLEIVNKMIYGPHFDYNQSVTLRSVPMDENFEYENVDLFDELVSVKEAGRIYDSLDSGTRSFDAFKRSCTLENIEKTSAFDLMKHTNTPFNKSFNGPTEYDRIVSDVYNASLILHLNDWSKHWGASFSQHYTPCAVKTSGEDCPEAVNTFGMAQYFSQTHAPPKRIYINPDPEENNRLAKLFIEQNLEVGIKAKSHVNFNGKDYPSAFVSVMHLLSPLIIRLFIDKVSPSDDIIDDDLIEECRDQLSNDHPNLMDILTSLSPIHPSDDLSMEKLVAGNPEQYPCSFTKSLAHADILITLPFSLLPKSKNSKLFETLRKTAESLHMILPENDIELGIASQESVASLPLTDREDPSSVPYQFTTPRFPDWYFPTLFCGPISGALVNAFHIWVQKEGSREKLSEFTKAMTGFPIESANGSMKVIFDFTKMTMSDTTPLHFPFQFYSCFRICSIIPVVRKGCSINFCRPYLSQATLADLRECVFRTMDYITVECPKTGMWERFTNY